MNNFTYLQAYSEELQRQIGTLLESGALKQHLLSKYPQPSEINNDAQLRSFVMEIKNQYMKKSAPISKIAFDPKIHVVNHALGMHSFVSRKQGGKLKAKNELRVSTLFKNTPVPFIQMIAVHELAHLREKAHNKAFYQLCCHMMPDYHQVEFDVRVYLTQLEEAGRVYD